MGNIWLGFVCAIMMFLLFMTGWSSAHITVANECKLLNTFYVGSTVYECNVKGNK